MSVQSFGLRLDAYGTSEPAITIKITDTGRPGVMRWSASWGDFEDTGETWPQALWALAGWIIDAERDGKVLR